MKKQGFSIIEIILLLGLIALIVWGVDYISTKDFVTVRTPTATVSNNTVNTVATSATTTAPNITNTYSSTPTKTTNPQPAIVPSPDLTVTFTDKGFLPAILTVKKGQTVTFVNNSSGKMWVAANPFPSSSDYPAFNEKTGSTSNASWSFTFDKVGTWFYHNHYSPAQGAKIVVSAK